MKKESINAYDKTVKVGKDLGEVGTKVVDAGKSIGNDLSKVGDMPKNEEVKVEVDMGGDAMGFEATLQPPQQT